MHIHPKTTKTDVMALGTRIAGSVAAVLIATACGGTPPAEAPTSNSAPAAATRQLTPLQEAVAAIKAGDFEVALDAAKRARDADPASAPAAFYAGVAEERLGQFEAAKQSLTTAIELDPGLLEARANLSGLFIDANQGQEALAIIDPGLKLAPQDPSLLMNRAIALVLANKREEAAAAYEKVLAVVNNDPELHADYAQLLVQLGKKEQAAKQFGMAMASVDPQILTGVAAGFARLGDFTSCAQALDKAIGVHDTASVRVRRAACRHFAKDDDGAEQDYLAAIKLQPDAAVGYFYYARHLAVVGRNAEAIEYLDKALAQKPTDALKAKIDAARAKLAK